MNPNPPPGCPFVAGSALQNSQSFVGRQEALDSITSRSAAAQPTSINVFGKRKIGKSSLLYRFCETYEQRVQRYGRNPSEFVAIYLSLQDAQCNKEANFYKAVADKLLQRPSVQGNQDLTAPLSGGSLDRQSFAGAMYKWKARGVLPILCLDKIEELFQRADEFDNGFYDSLRSLMDGNALMLVITSEQRLDVYSRKRGLTSDFFNVGHVVHLLELTELEAGDLVRLPDPNNPALSPEKQQLALDWGGRHPYLLQLAGFWLWEARQQQDRPIRWAKQKFNEQAQRFSRPRFHPSRWWRPLKCLFWDLPRKFGSLAKFIGATKSDVGDWMFGSFILIALGALALGVPWTEVIDFIREND
ncbi:MAG: ATP-binding protein [Oscillatoria sp. SIO1A7]|nr:ATP-binding protein [Oscillatoria sp. SIO1A7]